MKKTPTSRSEAKAMIEKKQKKIENPAEDKLQRDIVVAFYDKYPETINILIGYDANSVNDVEGARKLAMGTRKGVSDLMWFDKGVCHGLELKVKGYIHDSLHVLRQCDFILNKCQHGAFIISLDMFFDYIENNGNGIPAEFVKKYINETGLKNVDFGKIYTKYLEVTKI